MMLQGTTFAVGLALLAATAHVTIAHAGGYGSPHAVLTIAIALGVGVAALAIGSAWSARRWALTAWLAVAIVAGEAFGFMMTAERLVVGRETAQAPLRAHQDLHAKAARRVDNASASLAGLPATSPRLDAAAAAKAAADQAAIDKSAERGCRDNCRQLLQAQVDAAGREVDLARAELHLRADAAIAELAAARAGLAGLQAPASATPLADRVGVAAWLIDLVTAALGSLAANGLACGLIAFAGHGRRRARAVVVEAVDAAPGSSSEIPAPEQASRFAFESLFPADKGAGVDVLEIDAAYRRWCRAKGIEPLPGARFGQALGDLFEGVGIPVAERQGRMIAVGVALKPERQPLQLIAHKPARGGPKLGRMAETLKAVKRQDARL